MAKEVMIFTADEIKTPAALTPAALDAYRFALEKAGIETNEDALPEFISARNAKAGGFADLWEFKSWCEKVAASIKEVAKHAFNVGSADELPNNVSWSKQSFTYEFQEGAGAIVAKSLVNKGLVTKDTLLNLLTPTALAKACGLTVEKIMDMYPDTVVEKPKERTLKIK